MFTDSENINHEPFGQNNVEKTVADTNIPKPKENAEKVITTDLEAVVKDELIEREIQNILETIQGENDPQNSEIPDSGINPNSNLNRAKKLLKYHQF